MRMEESVAKAILEIKGCLEYEVLQAYVDDFMCKNYVSSDFEYVVDYRDFYTADMLDDVTCSKLLKAEVMKYLGSK